MAWFRNDRRARGRDGRAFVPGPASLGVGRVGIGQVVLWEATLLAAAAAALRPVGTARVVGSVLAVLLVAGVLAATAVRVRGRWLYEWALIRLRSRRAAPRARAALAPQVSVAAPGPLGAPVVPSPSVSSPPVSSPSVSSRSVSSPPSSVASVSSTVPPAVVDATAAISLPVLDAGAAVVGPGPLPVLEVVEVTDRAGARHGLVRVAQGWAAVLQVPTDADVVAVGDQDPATEPPMLPWSVLAAALDDRGVRLQAVQVVRLVAVAPTVGFEQSGPLVDSYAVRAGGSPSRQRLYVALRLRPQDCPRAVAARGGGDEGAARALVSAVARLRQQLAGNGIHAAPLNREQVELAVRTVLAASVEDAPLARPDDPRRWKAWYADGRCHVAFTLSRWRTGTDPAALLTEPETLPATACISSTTLVQDPHRPVRLTATVRYVCPPEDRDRLRGLVAGLCRARRVVLLPMDGEHRQAALATVPLAGARAGAGAGVSGR